MGKVTVLQLINLIDAAQSEYNAVLINKDGDQVEDFIINDFYDKNTIEEYKTICNAVVKSFLYCNSAITIEI